MPNKDLPISFSLLFFPHDTNIDLPFKIFPIEATLEIKGQSLPSLAFALFLNNDCHQSFNSSS